MILEVSIYILAIGFVQSQVPLCCRDSGLDSPCKNACERLSVNSYGHEHVQKIASLTHTCSADYAEFWSCINRTFPVVSGDAPWAGRLCCHLSFSSDCRQACLTGNSRNDLGTRCRQSDEMQFFSCIDRQQASDECCLSASGPQCSAVCRNIFLKDFLPSQEERNAVQELCRDNRHITQCVQNYTRTTPAHNPHKGLPCCEKAATPVCRQTCETVLVTLTTEQEIMEEIIKSCGDPLPMDPMWQCFLTKSSDTSARDETARGAVSNMVLDAAKLQCCGKATSRKCRDLCVRTYTRHWSQTWHSFSRECQFSPNEVELNMCLTEIEEPCQMGCSGLNYCSNFNYRPSSLFRSCNARADKNAREDMLKWEDGIIYLPLMNIPVKNIKQCQPDMWKAIACALQVKPCHSSTHTNLICRSDCISILSECVDWSKLSPDKSAEELCATLSPEIDDNKPCTSLSQYIVPSPHRAHHREVTNPCSPNPCNNSHVCVVNRHKCKHPENCKPYLCKQGCQVGEVSMFTVPVGSYVRVPASNSHANCHKVCRCGHRKGLEHCRSMKCTKHDSCIVGAGHIHDHGSKFHTGCNRCVCQAGEVICSKRQCSPVHSSNDGLSGLPCNCPAIYDPVCGANGRTYPSECMARCSGNIDFLRGACKDYDPCQREPCGRSYKCLERRRVCLSTDSKVCKQYECVSLSLVCNRHHHDPVCSVGRIEFNNICQLWASGKDFAHRGHCKDTCNMVGEVCGHDGVTYPNECSAWGQRVAVDYEGQCKAVGTIALDGGDTYCEGIDCPVLPVEHCAAITPPGACCPICASEIRLLYSKTQSDLASHAAKVGPITVQNVTEALSQLISTKECEVFGYLSVETDIVVLIMPITLKPTRLQIEACNTEAERIVSLIESRSPTILSYMPLSSLMTATLRNPVVHPLSSGATYYYPSVLLWTSIMLFILEIKSRTFR